MFGLVFICALAWVVPAVAEDAPVTWPSEWQVTEEVDSDGDTTWTASKDDEKGNEVASIDLMRIDSGGADESDLRTFFNAMRTSIMKQRAVEIKCDGGRKTMISSLPSYESVCDLVMVGDPMKMILTTTLTKDNVYSFVVFIDKNVYETYLPHWKAVRASARF